MGPSFFVGHRRLVFISIVLGIALFVNVLFAPWRSKRTHLCDSGILLLQLLTASFMLTQREERDKLGYIKFGQENLISAEEMNQEGSSEFGASILGVVIAAA